MNNIKLKFFLITLGLGLQFYSKADEPVILTFKNATNLNGVTFDVFTNMGDGCKFSTPRIGIGSNSNWGPINLNETPQKLINYGNIANLENLKLCESGPTTGGQTAVNQIVARIGNQCINMVSFNGENFSNCLKDYRNQYASQKNIIATLTDPCFSTGSGKNQQVASCATNSSVGGGTVNPYTISITSP